MVTNRFSIIRRNCAGRSERRISVNQRWSCQGAIGSWLQNIKMPSPA